MSIEQNVGEQLRGALRGVGASVTAISTGMAHRRHGMLATAVMPLSLEPPTLVVAINRSTSIHAPLMERGAFVVNVLTRWDARMANGFASAKGESRFANGSWASRKHADGDLDDLPYLASAQAVIFCRVGGVHTSGTHSLVIGHVVEVAQSGECTPLLYCNGTYGTFEPAAMVN